VARVLGQAGFSTEAGQLDGGARRRILIVREESMITRYTDHAANERTFLAWIRTGLAVTAFGFFLVKLNVFIDVTDGASHAVAEHAGAFVAAVARYAGLAMVVTGIAIIGRSSTGFERTRRAIDRDEVIQMPRSYMESLLSVALAIAVAIFCVYLEVL
jgi:putative membrane protein